MSSDTAVLLLTLFRNLNNLATCNFPGTNDDFLFLERAMVSKKRVEYSWSCDNTLGELMVDPMA
ncbi:MAG: hypothetical protein IPI91_02995 [Flavobacteriales bacterium]|nr:hypothetical protein [Flavobacteriales bacterium]